MLKIQIVYPDGQVVKTPAGGLLEADLVKLIADEISPTNLFHIGTRQGLEFKIRSALYKFKSRIREVPVGLNKS